MVRRTLLRCPECNSEFEFDFDSHEFREYGGAECPHCEHEMEHLAPSDYFMMPEHTAPEGPEHESEVLGHIQLENHRCNACEEVFGIKEEFSGEVNCPYCGAKYA